MEELRLEQHKNRSYIFQKDSFFRRMLATSDIIELDLTIMYESFEQPLGTAMLTSPTEQKLILCTKWFQVQFT